MSIDKPTVGGSTNTWGTRVNAALDDLDTQIAQAHFNVKEYNATGNGGSDDTAEIQAAITAAEAAGGGVVFFPAGTYVVTPVYHSRALTAASNVTLRGVGAASIIKVKDSSPKYKQVIGHDYATAVDDFCVESLAFDLNKANNTHPTGVVADEYAFTIDIHKGDRLTVQNCFFKNYDSVNTIVFNGSQSGGTFLSHDVHIINNSFLVETGATNVHDHSTIYIDAPSAVVAGNSFVGPTSGTPSSGLYAAIEMHGPNQAVTGNTVEGYRDGINVGPSHYNDNVSVTGNTIRKGLRGIQLYSLAYYSAASPVLKTIDVSGNSIQLDPNLWEAQSAIPNRFPCGITVYAEADKAVAGISITGNNVWCEPYVGTDTAIATNLTSSGIYVSRPSGATTNVDRGVSIVGNNIYGFPSCGIMVSSLKMTGLTVTDNTIGDVGHASITAASDYKAGIFIGGECANAKISNNHVYDTRGTSPMRRGVTWLATSGSTLSAITDNWIQNVDASSKGLNIGATSGSPFVRHVIRDGATTLPANATAYGSTMTDVAAGAIHQETAAPTGTTWS